jgi:D-psicose/D-tagatose/L-ribulose 3-epimerase
MKEGLLGVHALVWGGASTPEQYGKIAERARAAGFSLLEIPLLNPDELDSTTVGRMIARAGLQVSCSLGLRFEADISSADPAVVARGREHLYRALGAAQALGASHLVGVLYSALGKYAIAPTERGREHCIEVLRGFAADAADAGVTLGLEVVNRYESNLVNTASDALQLSAAIGASNVMVHLDTYHMNIEEEDFRSPVVTCGSRLGYVHVGESHRGYLGTGTVNFPAFFGALTDVHYQGPIVFEGFGSRQQLPSGLVETLALWRSLWSDPDDLARHAREFIMEGRRPPAPIR